MTGCAAVRVQADLLPLCLRVGAWPLATSTSVLLLPQHLDACDAFRGCACVCVQWGAVEKEPRQYNWSGYKQVLEMLKQTGLKVQVRAHPSSSWALRGAAAHD